MRVLFVSHDYLPNHPSGTEIYTAELSRKLRARGVEVELFTTEKDIARKHLSLDEREWDGMRVHELVNNLFYDEFAETWDWPPAEAAFARVLDRVRPDVVHVMHLLYLSIGCVEEAHRRGIPVVYSLHDFWLTCARFGQLIHADGSICYDVDFERCGTCLAQLKFKQTPLERGAARVVAGVRSVSGINLEGVVRSAAAVVGGSAGGAPPADEARRFAALAAQRDAAIQARLVPLVRRFFAPSLFLRRRFVDWGVPEERIEHVPNGIEVGAYDGFQRTPSENGELRIAFLGTLAPHKAPHVVLDAWERLPAAQRARARLTLYGPTHHVPDYVEGLAARASELGVAMPGGLARADVPGAWREIDVLVVPSVWFENAPLTLLEARATRTPALVSDLGGMAELVEEGRHGWRFPAGDAGALARLLEGIIDDAARLATLDYGDRPTPRMSECADLMIERYRSEMERDA